jgi:thioredoxin 1
MSHNVIHLSENDFEREVEQSDLPVVIDFWAPWCGPCRQVGPVIERLADDYAGKVKVAKVNVDEEKGLAQAFKVQGIPTLVAMQGDLVVGHQVGFSGPDGVKQLFDEALAHAAKAGKAA